MIKTEDFLKSKSALRLPSNIYNHNVFKKHKEIKKIFPLIGLENEIASQPITISSGQKYSLYFSSDKIIGLWDIATMSMRGVMSCMHWYNSHCHHLIGSMVDPFLGMIYLSDNEITEYGPAIIKRCLVRFLIHNGKRVLFLERVYTKSDNKDPHTYLNRESNSFEYISVFEKYLKEKTNNKFEIYNSVYKGFYPIKDTPPFIPLHDIIYSLKVNELSLSDYGLNYYGNPDSSKVISEFNL